MSRAFVADVFRVGKNGPEIKAGAADPSAGAGVPANAIGSFYMRTSDATWWRKVGAADTAWVKDEVALAQFLYTATGAEGSGPFAIVIPAPFTPLASASYYIMYSLEDVAFAFVITFPNGVGDRTTTQFNIDLTAALTAGDKIRFTLYPI